MRIKTFAHKSESRGFTIVELLIVITVIAILAAITTVVYNGIQARANDARLHSAVAQFEKALKLWASENTNILNGNSGSSAALSNGTCSDGNGTGFVSSTTYTCTTEDVLVAAGLLPSNFLVSLPRNKDYGATTTGKLTVMIYPCGSTGRYGLYWYLESPSSADTAQFDSTRTTCGTAVNVRDNLGMRAGKIIQL